MSDRPKLSISVKGDDAMTGAVHAAEAMLNLLDVLTEEAAPGAGLHWRVASMGWKCDRCGKQAGLELPETWTKDGSDDLCEACSRKEPPAA